MNNKNMYPALENTLDRKVIYDHYRYKARFDQLVTMLNRLPKGNNATKETNELSEIIKNRCIFLLKDSNSKDNIINLYKETNNKNFIIELKNFLDEFNNIEEFNELKQVVNERLKELEKKDLKEIIEEVKNNNPELYNFEILESPKEINDKNVYDIKENVYYLKLNENGKQRIFEIDQMYIDEVKRIFGNKESFKNLSTSLIIEKISPYIHELNQNNLNSDTILDDDIIKEEIDKIYDSEQKRAALRDINQIKIERNKIYEYIKKVGLTDLPLNYSFNSNGERLYLLGDKTIKFVGPEKRMYFLKGSENEMINDIQASSNETNTEQNTNNSINNEQYGNDTSTIINNLNDLNNEAYISIIKNSIEKIYTAFPLTTEESKLIDRFLTLCLEANENDIPPILFDIFNNNYESLYEYASDNLKIKLKEKIDKKNLEEQKEKEQKDNRNLTLVNKENGFANIIYILCSIIVAVLGIVYLILIR